MSGSGVEFFSKFRQCFFSILIVSPLGKGWDPSFVQTWTLLPKDDFLPSLDYIWRSGSWENVFKFLKCTFAISLLSPLGKGQCPIFEQIWISFTQCKEDLCQVWLKLAQWLWRRRFLNVVNSYFLFYYYVPLVKGVALHLNKLEFPLSKDALCQVWLKMAIWFRTRFSNFVNVFSLFRYYFPLERNMILHLHKL